MPGHREKVLVSGCFDLLHSGHVRFLQAAAEYGRLFVSVGADETVARLKGRRPVCSQAERLYMVKALGCVEDVLIGRGTGVLDFQPELSRIRPETFVVNEDGDSAEKRQLCRELGVAYVVLRREPLAGLPRRSTTEMRRSVAIPYRIDLAGGWLDQPFVSQHAAGPVIVASVAADREFPCRCGMATSTRAKAQELWGARLPEADPQQLGRILFAYENPPGKREVAGSQDALGIVCPGISRLDYDGDYWPQQVESIVDEVTLAWLEGLIYLKPLGPRPKSFCVLDRVAITPRRARKLADAARACWDAIRRRDAVALGEAVGRAFRAQVQMFPLMANPAIEAVAERLPRCALGKKLTGAGGGGYLLVISEQPLAGCLRLRIRRPHAPGAAEPATGSLDARVPAHAT